jgi:hypothetical protein
MEMRKEITRMVSAVTEKTLEKAIPLQFSSLQCAIVRQRDGKLRSDAEFTGHCDFSMMQLDNPFNKGEAQSSSMVAAAAGGMCKERIEYFFNFICRNTDARIGK